MTMFFDQEKTNQSVEEKRTAKLAEFKAKVRSNFSMRPDPESAKLGETFLQEFEEFIDKPDQKSILPIVNAYPKLTADFEKCFCQGSSLSDSGRRQGKSVYTRNTIWQNFVFEKVTNNTMGTVVCSLKYTGKTQA